MRLIGMAAGMVVAALALVSAQQQSHARPGEGGIEVLQLRPNFYMLVGAGGNIAVQTGVDGTVVVDTGTAARASAVVDTIRKLGGGPIRYVINTSADADHAGGNAILASAGQTLFTTPDPLSPIGASIVSSQRALARMSAPAGQAAAFPESAWPTETFDHGRKYMYLNGEGIEILHQPAAHTDGDVFVFFRRSDVVVAGDVFETERFPVIDVSRGGSVDGEIAALNRLVELAIPSIPIVSREEGTWVVPGHGRLSDQLDVVQYRDMITIVRDRVRELVKAGMTLEQVQATSPARGYVRRYGADSGPWTTDAFVEAVYRSLSAASAEASAPRREKS